MQFSYVSCILLLPGGCVYMVLICSSSNYDPDMDNAAFVSHVICAVYETRSSFQMYNQLITLFVFLFIVFL